MSRPFIFSEQGHIVLLQLIADGETQENVAQRYGISELTVRNYLARLRQELGAVSTGNAIAIAIRRGLIR